MSRIFTQASLQQRSLPELRAAFAKAQQELVQSAPASDARRTALVNLDVISLAMAERMAGPRP